MNSLTALLKNVLSRVAQQSTSSDYRRLVLGGIPAASLERLFTELTDGNGSPWQPVAGISIPVFLVTRDPNNDNNDGPSQQCNWDYALAIRNSLPSFLLLVDALNWDDRTYSIMNATDTISRPLPPIRRSLPPLRNWSEFYARLTEAVADEIGISYSVIESAIRNSLFCLPSLSPDEQHQLPWQLLDDIASLSDLDGVVDANDLARVCGLLPFSSAEIDYRRSRATLQRLADFLDDVGIESGIDDLRSTVRGRSLSSSFDPLADHLRNSAGSASALVRAPCFYYVRQMEQPHWWSQFTVEAVDEMLAERGRSVPTDRIDMACIAPLNPLPQSGAPFLVRDAVSVEVIHPSGVFPSLSVSRLIGRSDPTLLYRSDARQSPCSHQDSDVPRHDVPITYRAEADGARPASIQVVSLASYGPAGFATCVGTSVRKVSRPRRKRASAPWSQEISLHYGGPTILRVFCGPQIFRVRAIRPSVHRMEQAVEDGVADLQLDLDEDVEIGLELLGNGYESISSFSIQIALDQDTGESSPSQFDALVGAHQSLDSTVPSPRSADTWLRRAESELLHADLSWRPVLATTDWSRARPKLDDARRLGSLMPHVDPRPALGPPPSFISTRDEVISWLVASPVGLPELELANEEAKRLAVNYLRAYREWIEQKPAEACWADTISILEPEPERYGSQAVAAPEPIAVLLSPLHPIRFGWHVAAQDLLTSSLEAPCPLAGLLDPHRIPEVLSLALTRGGGAPKWASYVALASSDAMWGVFWNTERLRDLHQHEAVGELVAAGSEPRGIQSGFTASQARRTLEEINHVLPTRAILRIGIVGSGRASSSCTEGLVKWSREPYSKETFTLAGPRSIEVYDARARATQPSSEQVSSLADDTRHSVRWYSSNEVHALRDLAIVDHLGSSSPNAETHPWRSPSTAGGLIRTRIRLDRNDAELVIESRAGDLVRSEDNLLDELGLAIHQVESVATARCECSHIAFVPNQHVVGTELVTSRFLAVSSTEIDPACFARGSSQSGGYLWDYELPDAVGAGEQTDGFYLLARPPTAIKRAVSRATSIVSDRDVDIESLLQETSRRGIPILKRLASGGSLAKGELGMLLAVRLLQDAFRGESGNIRLPVWQDNTVRMVLPVDPYTAPFQRIRAGFYKANATSHSATRPDLLVVHIFLHSQQSAQIRLIPIEVKFREGNMGKPAMAEALAQANSLGRTLHHLLRATPLNNIWRICGLSFLSSILDHGFRVYGDPAVNGTTPEEWVKIHQNCLADIARDSATFDIAEEGRLLVFDDSLDSGLHDVDGDGFAETLIINRNDSRSLLGGGVELSDSVDRVVELLDLGSALAESADDPVSSDDGELRETPTSDSEHSDDTDVPLHELAHVPEPDDTSVVPAIVRERVDGSFADFIGNKAAIDTLKRSILKAMLSEPPQLPVSYLFTGNPSTGKTELARRVSLSLALPFVSLDGRGLVSRENLFQLIDGRLRDYDQAAVQVGTRYQLPVMDYPPLVVFVDEVHLVSRPIQESLLTALEPSQRSVLLSDRVAQLSQVTFLFATTRPSDVDMAFRTRCTEVPLRDYSEEEVAEIVAQRHAGWPKALLHRIAKSGRLVPRTALEIARELADEALVSEHQDRELGAHLDEVQRTRQVDENGLSRIDIEYLSLLEREGRPLGERNILSMLPNVDKDRFVEEVEPLLIARMQLVRRTSRGREITAEGRRYLIEFRRREAEAN